MVTCTATLSFVKDKGGLMSYKEEMQDKMHKLVDGLIETFGGPDTPMTHWNILLLKYSIESQRVFAEIYQDYLNNPLKYNEENYEENINNMMKYFMKASLEMTKLWRNNRENFLKVQSEIVKDYLGVIQE